MPTNKTSFTLVFAVWAAGLGAAAQFAKIAVVFSDITAAYSDAGHLIGFSMSLVGFVGLVFGVFAGLLVSQMRSKQVLCTSLLLGAIISLYQASLPALPMFLLSRVVEGISHLAIVVAAPTLISQLSNEQHRGFTMTLWGTFFGIAFALTALVGVPLVANYGLASLFIAHASYMLCIAVLLAVALPNQVRSHGHRATFSPQQVVLQHVHIYRSAQLAAPAIGWLFYTLTFVALLTVLPGFVDLEQRIFVASAMPLASIAVSMTLGVLLLRYMPAFRCVQLGFLLALAVVLIIFLTQASVVLSITLAAVLGLVQGASFASVPQLNPSREEQALANGAIAQMGNLGTTLGLPLMLLMTDNWAITGLVVFIATLYVLGAGSHQLLSHRRSLCD